MVVIFLGKISPQNDTYVSSVFDQLFSTKGSQTKSAHPETGDIDDSLIALNVRHMDAEKVKLMEKEISASRANDKPLIMASIRANTRPFIPEPNINTAPYQQKDDTSEFRQKLLRFIHDNKDALPMSATRDSKIKLPGKIIAFKQTMDFMRQHPQKIIFGDGIGNFSSALAFRTAALNIDGGYPAKLRYISPEFFNNHLDIYLFFFSTLEGFHSVINTPDSVYDQLVSEYGMLGLSAFCVFYIWFFLKNKAKRRYSLPLVFLLLGFFVVGYWFEQLTIVVFFELLMFLNLKNNLFREKHATA